MTDYGRMIKEEIAKERHHDDIERPEHYTYSGIEPVQVIMAWELPYCLGNVIKYVARHRHKGNPLRDLKKAKRYLEIQIERMESETKKQHLTDVVVVEEGEDG